MTVSRLSLVSFKIYRISRQLTSFSPANHKIQTVYHYGPPAWGENPVPPHPLASLPPSYVPMTHSSSSRPSAKVNASKRKASGATSGSTKSAKNLAAESKRKAKKQGNRKSPKTDRVCRYEDPLDGDRVCAAKSGDHRHFILVHFGRELNASEAPKDGLPLRQATAVIYTAFEEVVNSGYQGADAVAIRSVLARVSDRIRWNFRDCKRVVRLLKGTDGFAQALEEIPGLARRSCFHCYECDQRFFRRDVLFRHEEMSKHSIYPPTPTSSYSDA